MATYGEGENGIFNIDKEAPKISQQQIVNSEWCAPSLFKLDNRTWNYKYGTLIRSVDMYSNLCLKFPSEYRFLCLQLLKLQNLISFALDAEVGTHERMFSKGQLGTESINLHIEYDVLEPCEIIIGTLAKKLIKYDKGWCEII